MSRPIIFDLADHLATYCTTKGYPTLQLNFLQDTGNSLAIQQTASDVVEKEYISGSKIYRVEFDILAQGSEQEKLHLQEYLNDFCFYFTDLQNLELSDRRILTARATAPSIRFLTENKMLNMGISVSLTYKE